MVKLLSRSELEALTREELINMILKDEMFNSLMAELKSLREATDAEVERKAMKMLGVSPDYYQPQGLKNDC